MSTTTWIIAALLIASFYQYHNPEKANEMLKPVWGAVENIWSGNNFLGGSKANTTVSQCPDDDNPVCGNDGKTYKNICEAAYADVLQVTPGAC